MLLNNLLKTSLLYETTSQHRKDVDTQKRLSTHIYTQNDEPALHDGQSEQVLLL